MGEVPSSPPRVLLVDDDADVGRAASMLAERRGMVMRVARSPSEAWSLLAVEPVDVVLLDLNYGPGERTGAEGLRMLGALLAHDPDAVVVVVTGQGGISVAVAAMRAGAADFVMKPWNNDRLVATLTEAAVLSRRRRAALPAETAGSPLVGESAAFARALEVMRRAAATEAPVLLIGEAGTGKSLMAETIHRLSSRAGPFVRLGPDETVAVEPGGTLFLDEVCVPMAAQVRLLGLLDRAGDVRVVSATRTARADLARAMLPDLLYRLNTVEIELPPLRAREGDAVRLAEHWLRVFSRQYRRNLRFSAAALEAIAGESWPENVRALRHVVERAVVLAGGDVLEPSDLPIGVERPAGVSAPVPGEGDLNLARSEKAMVQAALKRAGFNVSHAAKELGLTRAALYRRMARHGL